MSRLRSSVTISAALIAVFTLSVYLLTGSSDLNGNGDTDLRYQTTQAIVDHHRLWIAHPMWLDTRVATGIGGHLYAFYGPGQAVFMIPLYVAGKVLAHHLQLPYDITTLYAARSLDLWLGAALVVMFYLMALATGYTRRTAVILSVIFGLASTAWPDAQSALEQTQVNLFLLIAVYAVWRFVRGGMNDRVWLVVSGTAMGLCVFTRYDGILYFPIVALYPAVLRWCENVRGKIVKDWLALGVSFLPWGLIILVWNMARFGLDKPWETGLHEATFGEPFWSGFTGLMVSPGKGLIWYLPLVFLLPWAFPRFARLHRSLAWLFIALIVVPVLFYSNVLYWHGDPAWGPRYLYTAVPYLILPVGVLIERWHAERRWLHAALIVLVAISFVFELSAVSVTQWRFWYRLEVAEKHTSDPFRWGASNYHYYWNATQSPIVMQLEDVYQVIRLDMGDRHYDYTARPTTLASNPADNYPINSLAFWWADVRHPLFGARVRGAIAGTLAVAAILSGALLCASVWPVDRRARTVRELSLARSELPRT